MKAGKYARYWAIGFFAFLSATFAVAGSRSSESPLVALKKKFSISRTARPNQSGLAAGTSGSGNADTSGSGNSITGGGTSPKIGSSDNLANAAACPGKWDAIYASANNSAWDNYENASFFTDRLAKLNEKCSGVTGGLKLILTALNAYGADKFKKELSICLTYPTTLADTIAFLNEDIANTEDWCKKAKPCLEAGSTVQKGNCVKIPSAIATYQQSDCHNVLSTFLQPPALKVPDQCKSNGAAK